MVCSITTPNSRTKKKGDKKAEFSQLLFGSGSCYECLDDRDDTKGKEENTCDMVDGESPDDRVDQEQGTKDDGEDTGDSDKSTVDLRGFPHQSKGNVGQSANKGSGRKNVHCIDEHDPGEEQEQETNDDHYDTENDDPPCAFHITKEGFSGGQKSDTDEDKQDSEQDLGDEQ